MKQLCLDCGEAAPFHTFECQFNQPVKRGVIGCGTDERAKINPRRRQEGGDHYLNMGVQPWDVVDTWPREQRIGYYRGGALKYIMRMGSKDESPQEVAKGKHYIEKLLEVLREEE